VKIKICPKCRGKQPDCPVCNGEGALLSSRRVHRKAHSTPSVKQSEIRAEIEALKPYYIGAEIVKKVMFKFSLPQEEAEKWLKKNL
jgi:transposase